MTPEPDSDADMPQVAVCSWLETSLKTLQNSPSLPAAGVTTKQLVEFHRAVTGAESAPDVSQAIREFARLEPAARPAGHTHYCRLWR